MRLAAVWTMLKPFQSSRTSLRSAASFSAAAKPPSAPSTVSPTSSAGRSAFFSRSEEHTSELQSLMRISYAVFCLQNKKSHDITPVTHTHISRRLHIEHNKRNTLHQYIRSKIRKY